MSHATPTRWKVVNVRHVLNRPVESQIVQDGGVDDGYAVVEKVSPSYAAQIVREHNAHEAMVEGLGFVLAMFQQYGDNPERFGSAISANLERLIEALEQAKKG